MKNSFLIVLICCCSCIANSQNEIPSIKTSYDTNANDYKNTLVINSKNSFDLNKFNEFNSEFKIIAHNDKKFVLEHSYSSLNKSKGRCAAGLEKKLLLISFDDDFKLLNSENYLLESCLFSIELTKQEKRTQEYITYHCENIQSLDLFQLKIDLRAMEVIRTKI